MVFIALIKYHEYFDMFIDLSKKILLSKKITFISILINVDINRTMNIVHRNDT